MYLLQPSNILLQEPSLWNVMMKKDRVPVCQSLEGGSLISVSISTQGLSPLTNTCLALIAFHYFSFSTRSASKASHLLFHCSWVWFLMESPFPTLVTWRKCLVTSNKHPALFLFDSIGKETNNKSSVLLSSKKQHESLSPLKCFSRSTAPPG